ncbi:zinc finger protein GLIS2-like [Lycodopsis pacificus]
MLSLDEPLDLKLPVRKRACPSSVSAPFCIARPRLLCSTFPSPPSSPESQSSPRERPGSCFSPPAMDLSLSPSSRHASSLSPSPSSPASPFPSSPMESPRSISSPQPHLFSWELTRHRGLEGGASPQGYPFYLPIGSPPKVYSFPSSVFIGQNGDKQTSPEPSLDGQLACRWMKCHLLFDSLQDLVDHINDLHVKPEKDCGYCCRWDGCARNGRGFNARYKMLIHIRTHTNEKPHHCPTCSKSFSRLENLKIHTRSHTGEKPYVCPYDGCSKRYSNSSDRFKHTRTHYVDKPYCCKMSGCMKRYTDPSSLRKHIKAHGHFVSPERGAGSAAGLGPALMGPQRLSDLQGLCGAHLILPGGPFSAFCHRGAPLFSLTGGGSAVRTLALSDSPLLHFGLSAASVLGLGALGALGRVAGRQTDGEEEEEAEGEEREVLNLSAGHRRRELPLSWLVVPPRALLLQPAVVS